MKLRTGMLATIVTAGALATFAACGSDGGNPTGPGNSGGGSPGPSGATITISGGRVSPSEVTINTGQSVTFVNSDGSSRNVSSDPHPNHTDCPEINAVSNVSNGQSKLTNAFSAARTCGFHDHDDPNNANRKGRIVVR